MTDAESLRFPIYMPSRGRAGRSSTLSWLQRHAKPGTWDLTIVTSEPDAYRDAYPDLRVIPISQEAYDEYDYTPELVGKGHPDGGIARNTGWQDAIERGFTHHWSMDDNFTAVQAWHRGVRHWKGHLPMLGLRALEDFALRWSNLAAVSAEQAAFGSSRQTQAWTIPSRMYCCVLWRNDIKQRYRRGLNDDTILSLDVLEAGWLTASSRRVMAGKMPTGAGRVAGGMTDVYREAGFMRKFAEAARCHPKHIRLIPDFRGRPHHRIDYSAFKNRRLIEAPDGYWQEVAEALAARSGAPET